MMGKVGFLLGGPRGSGGDIARMVEQRLQACTALKDCIAGAKNVQFPQHEVSRVVRLVQPDQRCELGGSEPGLGRCVAVLEVLRDGRRWHLHGHSSGGASIDIGGSPIAELTESSIA